MSVLITKLEMATLSINAGRYDEAEKLIQEVLFEPSADSEIKVAGWVALGGIKAKMFNVSKATFDEVVYCYRKAIESNPNELNQILTTYFSMLVSTVLYNSELITAGRKKLGQAEGAAMFSATVGLISGLVALNSNSTLVKAAGIAGVGMGASNYVSNLADAEAIKRMISESRFRLQLIFSEFGTGLELSNELKEEFRLKIVNNPTIAKQLGYKDIQVLSKIATDFSDIVISSDELEKRVTGSTLFSVFSSNPISLLRKQIAPYLPNVFFALENGISVIIFTRDCLLISYNPKKFGAGLQLVEIPYDKLEPGAFRADRQNYFVIEVKYKGETYNIPLPGPVLSNNRERRDLCADAIDSAFN